MEDEYNLKRINPPIFQHDYHVLKQLYKTLRQLRDKYFLRKRNLKMVDYGCGTSPYKHIFEKFCSKYVGVDIERNGKADVVVGEEDKVPLNDETADAVISTQVLEHVKNPHFYLSECSRMLKKGGILILSTHGIWPYHPYPEDYRRWTSKGLKYEIEKHKFKIVEYYSVLGPYATIIQFKLLLLAESLGTRGSLAKIILAGVSVPGNILIFLSDKVFPVDEKSDASLFVVCAKKIG